MTKTSTAKQPSLVEQARKLPPSSRKSWFTLMPADAQAELLQLRHNYQAGKLPLHVSVKRLHELAANKFGDAFGVSNNTFQKWMGRTD